MILTDNRNVLRMKDRELLNKMSEWDHQQPTGQVIVEQAKTGVLTMKVIQDDKTQYLQSKYNPQSEAQRFAGKFTDEPIHYVLFVGVGTAYHIEAFMEDHPDAKFAIYEPNEEVLHAYLSSFRLDKLPVRNLLKIFTGIDQDQVTVEVQQLLAQSNNVLKIITLPVYEKMYGDQVNGILENALEAIKNKHSSLATNVAFQKRWTINSIKNFPTVLQTPNILHDIDRSAFEGKPAIIVAAGPSLNEEFENLRYIKENGLAYIFSVGSAVKSLVSQGIYPDATCTYDPQANNVDAVEEIISNNISGIPLIFGSSVGYETIEAYPGKMLHMIVNQDTVAPYLLKVSNNEEIKCVADAPSIAVITFQMLAKLNIGQIILVGQNLAYIDNMHYAEGIDYGDGSHIVSSEDIESSLTIKDVEGNNVKTNNSFNKMRQEMEFYIERYPNIKVYNSTKKGASIKGTIYKRLKNIIDEELHTKTVKENWLDAKGSYNKDIDKNIAILKSHAGILVNIMNKINNILNSISDEVSKRMTNRLESKYNQLDLETRKLKNNQFYKCFVEPMVRVQNQILLVNIRDLKYEKDLYYKAETIIVEFNKYLIQCKDSYETVLEPFKEMTLKIETIKDRK